MSKKLHLLLWTIISCSAIQAPFSLPHHLTTKDATWSKDKRIIEGTVVGDNMGAETLLVSDFKVILPSYI